MNITTTQLIARLYQKQENYKYLSDNVNSKMLNLDSKTTVSDVISIFELVKYDGLGTVQWLLGQLRETKVKLEGVMELGGYRQ